MISFFSSTSFFNSSRPLKGQIIEHKILYWLSASVALLAFLEFSQDYIASVLNNSSFSLSQSLSYKVFWFVFIPLTYFFLYLQNRFKVNFNKKVSLKKVFLIIFITTLHLLIFSFFLHLVSYEINETPWPFTYLISQKLSTRLYLALSFYITFSLIHFYLEKKSKEKNVPKSVDNTLLIKSGHTTSLIDTCKIIYITSDGPYLEVHIPEKRYVILGSLKKIIDSLPKNFRRIHKSTIVNIDQIVSSKSRGNGDYDLTLKSGKNIRLSRNYAKPLKGILH